MEILESEMLLGAAIVVLIIGLIVASAWILRIFGTLQENTPRYTPEILGQGAIAHEPLNPKGFVFYRDRVYPARALDKYISQGQPVIIIAYEKDVLVVRPLTAMDDTDTVE